MSDIYSSSLSSFRAFPGGSEVKNPQVQSLGLEDPLGKEMATHSSIIVWEIPWTKGPGRLQSMGLQKSQTQLSDSTTATATTIDCYEVKIELIKAVYFTYLFQIS